MRLRVHVDFDRAAVEPSFPQLLAEVLARAIGLFLGLRRRRRHTPGVIPLVDDRRRRRRQQDVEQAILGVLRRLGPHFGEALLAHHVDAELHQVADHRLHVAADIANLGELRRLDFQEWRLREARQPPRDLGLADAGRSDHEDVLRRNLFGQLRGQLLPPHAIPERDRDRSFGRVLANHVLVELRDNLTRRQRVGRGLGRFWKKDRH